MNNQQANTPIKAENRPASLEGAPGNLRYVAGEHMKNALGVAALLHIVSEMLKAVVQDPCGITKEDIQEFKETLNFIRGDIPYYVESFQTAVGCSLPSRFAVFSEDFDIVSRDYYRVSQDSVTPSRPLAKIAATFDLPRERSCFTKELEEEEEEERRLAATSKENWN